MKYCETCGSEIHDLAEMCPKCGVSCVKTKSGFSIQGLRSGVLWSLLLGIIGFILCIIFGDEKAKRGAAIILLVDIVSAICIYVAIDMLYLMI